MTKLVLILNYKITILYQWEILYYNLIKYNFIIFNIHKYSNIIHNHNAIYTLIN
jgi:hypothetical protein